MTETNAIRVFIVDDHPVVREGFCSLLEQTEDFVVAGEASSGEETLETIDQTESDLAIVDISMKGMDGIELTRRLGEILPELRVLIVSVHDETHYVEDAFDAGANGYVLKDNIHSVLPEAASSVMNGEMYLCEDLRPKTDL